MQWGAARISKAVDICLTCLQEELDIGQRVALNCEVEGSLATVEVLKETTESSHQNH